MIFRIRPPENPEAEITGPLFQRLLSTGKSGHPKMCAQNGKQGGVTLKDFMLSISKPSTLFTRENAVGRLLAHPLTTPALVAAEVSLIWFLHQRPAQDFPLWVDAALLLLIPALFAVSFCYIFVPLLMFMGVLPNNIEEDSRLTGATAAAVPAAAPAWRSEIYHREFFVFILAIPLAVGWLPWTTEVPANQDQFLGCVRSLHYPEGLRSLAVALQAQPNPTKSEFDNFCFIAAQVDVTAGPAKPATLSELVQKYSPQQ